MLILANFLLQKVSRKKKKLRQTMIKVWQSHTCIHKTLSATEVMNQD